MIYAHFESTDQREARAYNVYQYDWGQKLQVTGLESLDLPNHTEVHFALDGEETAITRIGTVAHGILTADVPFKCLQYAKKVYAYIYIVNEDDDGGQTIKQVTFTPQHRAKPDDDVTPDEERTVDGIIRELNAVSVTVTEAASEISAKSAEATAAATNAANSAAAAATSETNATAAAQTATTKATAAANSAVAAATSETNAASSARSAGQSEYNAVTASQAAIAKATEAANSATAAATSESNATGSAQTATTKATEAANSAAAAAASESNVVAKAAAVKEMYDNLTINIDGGDALNVDTHNIDGGTATTTP